MLRRRVPPLVTCCDTTFFAARSQETTLKKVSYTSFCACASPFLLVRMYSAYLQPLPGSLRLTFSYSMYMCDCAQWASGMLLEAGPHEGGVSLMFCDGTTAGMWWSMTLAKCGFTALTTGRLSRSHRSRLPLIASCLVFRYCTLNRVAVLMVIVFM